MTYFGSPMSNSYNNHEYDFQDDKLDEDLENDFPDDHHEGSDEDTEDASETDTGLSLICFSSISYHLSSITPYTRLSMLFIPCTLFFVLTD